MRGQPAHEAGRDRVNPGRCFALAVGERDAAVDVGAEQPEVLRRTGNLNLIGDPLRNAVVTVMQRVNKLPADIREMQALGRA